MPDDGDEFDVLYGDSFDEESLAQVEFTASQAVSGPSKPPAVAIKPLSLQSREHDRLDYKARSQTSVHQNASSARHSPPAKKQKVDSPVTRAIPVQAPVINVDDDEESMEVIWTENGYVTRPSSQRRRRQAPGPDDFEIRHSGPGRPPAIGAGYGHALYEDVWEGEAWAVDAGDHEYWNKAEEAAVRSSQQADTSRKPQQLPTARKLGVGVPRQDGVVNAQKPNGVGARGMTVTEDMPLQPLSRTQVDDRSSTGRSRPTTPSPPQVSARIAGSQAPIKNVSTDPTFTLGLQEELEAMRAQLQAALSESRTSKYKMYARDGEVKMVRDRNEKAERELAELRLKSQKQQEDFQRQLADREKAFAAEKERIDTNAAFFRLEHETSVKRLAWPGSVRRRATGGVRFAAGSQAVGVYEGLHSHSQFAPPPVMPTTPTRRAREEGAESSLSPHRSGSHMHTSPRRGDIEDSPSRGRERRDQKLPSLSAQISRKSTQKKAATFPGFDNSFAAAAPGKRAASSVSAHLPATRDSIADEEDMAVLVEPASPIMARANEPQPGPSSKPFDGTACTIVARQRRFRLAASTLFRRRTAMVALLLAHYSPRPDPPLSLPRSRYLSSGVASPLLVPEHTATIHRVLDVELPANTSSKIRERQQLATELLLTTMTDGASAAHEQHRFAFLKSLPERLPTSQEALEELDSHDYWDCQEIIQDGMHDMYEDLAVALRILLGIYLRLCMMDALQDVMLLMSALSIAEPAIINAFMASDLPYKLDGAHQEGGQIAEPILQTQTKKLQSDTRNEDAVPTPTQLPLCLIECVMKAGGVLPLRLSSPESVAYPDLDEMQAGSQHPGATQSRKVRAIAKRENEASLTVPWDMGSQQREDVLEAVLSLLEIFVWHIGHQCGFYLKSIFEAPGFVATFVDGKRPADTMSRFIRLLTQLVQYDDVWKSLVVCRFDGQLQIGLPVLIYKSRTPLLDLLAKHLVDSRHNQSTFDAHRLHCAINVLISQLVIKQDDALLLARESQSLFAALVQAIHTDTLTIWTEDGSRVIGEEKDAQDIVTRIILDVDLLSRIFYVEDHPEDLLDRLNSHESHQLLNGIRHCFILAFSRLAFADEPSWLPENCVKDLQTVADKCSDLIEVVLSPDEVEAVWEICAEDSGGEGAGEAGEEYDEDEVMGDGDAIAGDGRNQENARAQRGSSGGGGANESQTQSQSPLHDVAIGEPGWDNKRRSSKGTSAVPSRADEQRHIRSETVIGDDDEEAAMWGAR